MSRRLEIAAVAVLVLVFAGGISIAALSRGPAGVAPVGPPLQATAAFDSSELLFGDPVHAEVDVVGSAPARSIRLEARFDPYRIESQTRTATPLGAGRAGVRYRFTLSCLRSACSIENGQPGRMFKFPAAQVSAGGLQVEADWKPLVVFNRLLAERRPAPRTGEAFQRLPGSHPRSWLVGLGAGVLLLVAAVVPFLLPWRQAPRPDSASAHARLREALSCARDVATCVSTARIRAALEDLATELEGGGRLATAARVRFLAWGEQEPAAADVARLTAAIERELA
jgi:hypothetical protein